MLISTVVSEVLIIASDLSFKYYYTIFPPSKSLFYAFPVLYTSSTFPLLFYERGGGGGGGGGLLFGLFFIIILAVWLNLTGFHVTWPIDLELSISPYLYAFLSHML